MNYMNNVLCSLFLYFCTVQRQQVLSCGQCLPILKKISHQQLTLMLRSLCVEFNRLYLSEGGGRVRSKHVGIRCHKQQNSTQSCLSISC